MKYENELFTSDNLDMIFDDQRICSKHLSEDSNDFMCKIYPGKDFQLILNCWTFDHKYKKNWYWIDIEFLDQSSTSLCSIELFLLANVWRYLLTDA